MIFQKQLNRLAVFCVFLAAAAAAASGVMACRAEEAGDVPFTDAAGRFLDAVLVIDCSGSLDLPETGTDPEKLALEAAGLFTDMAEAEKTRIGIVAFSDRIEMNMPLTAISSEEDRVHVREAVRSLDYDYTGDTDLGEAARAAAQMLCSGDEDTEADEPGEMDAETQRARTILFFTDGWIDLPHASDPEAAEEASEKKLREALQRSLDEDIRVYTIMLGDDAASFDPVFAGSRIFHIGEAQELPAVYMDIFAELIGARPVSDGIEDIVIREPGSSAGTDFSIPPAPEGSIEEANVILISRKPISEITVYDSGGALLKPQVSLSEHYSLVKLRKPEGGTYHLDVSGQEPCTVNVNLLLNSSVTLRCSVEDGEDMEAARVVAWLEHGGERVTDPQICGAFRVTAHITDPEGEKEIPLLFSDGCFTADTPAPPGEAIHVRVHARSANTERWSDTEEYVNERYPEIICMAPEDEITLKGLFPGRTRCEICLNDYFRSWDATPLTWEITADSDCLIFREESDMLYAGGRSRGTGHLRVTAADRYGSRASQEFTVAVRTLFPSAGMAVLAAAGAAALAVFCFTAGIVLVKRIGSRGKQGILVYSLRAEGLFLSEEKNRYELERMRKDREDVSRIASRGKGGGQIHMPAREVTLQRGLNAPAIRCRSGACRLFTAENRETRTLKLAERTRFSICWEEDGRKAEMRCLYIPGDSAECTK